jgi:Pentapeptide repeats (8 copies)
MSTAPDTPDTPIPPDNPPIIPLDITPEILHVTPPVIPPTAPPIQVGSKSDKDRIGQIGESIRNSKQLFLLLAGAFVYVTITVVSLNGRDILERGRILLPLINLPVSFQVFFLLTPAMLLFLQLYFFLHLQQMSKLVHGIAEKENWREVTPWTISDNLIDQRRNWVNLQSYWVEIALWHFWPLNFALIALASIRIQMPWIVYVELGCGLVSILLGVLFRWNYFGGQRRFWFAYLLLMLCTSVLLTGVGLLQRNSLAAGQSETWRKFIGINASNLVLDKPTNSLGSSLVADRRSFQWASFRSSQVIGFQCEGCDLRYADFRDVKIVKGRFKLANLTGARFENASCIDCDFTLATLNDANLEHADITGSIMENAKLKNTNFRRATITNVAFEIGQAKAAHSFWGATVWWNPSFEATLRADRDDLFSKIDTFIVELP